LKNFGIKNEEEVVLPGINGKMNEIQAAIGLINLRHLEEERNKRAAVVNIYKQELADIEGISFNNSPPDIMPNYQYFVVRIEKKRFGISRDEVYDRLKEYNVFARKYFQPLCSEYQCYRHAPSAAPEKLPQAYKAADEVLPSLFMEIWP
jgi:dTDP-4-amino-4,6-dideoxygalactose transaminase